MASGNSNYNRGSMPVKSQSGTFSGFMNLTVYGSCLLAVILLMPILVFAVNVAWPAALIASLVLGIVLGMVFKLKGSWYLSLAALCIIAVIASVLISIIAG